MKKLKILGYVLVGLMLVAGVPYLWILSVESQRWSRLEQRVAQLGAEADARCRSHFVLRGTPLPGNAWDDYQKAFAVAKDIPDSTSFSSFDEAIRVQGDAAVESMQEGTRRAESRRVRLHEGMPMFELPDRGPGAAASKVSGLTVARSRLLQKEGRIAEAAELLLDLCRFGLDVENDGSGLAAVFGGGILARAVIELQELVGSRKAPPHTLSQIARELGLLDASLPGRRPAVAGDLEAFGEIILEDQFAQLLGTPPPLDFRDWRCAWRLRLLRTAGFDHADYWMTRLRYSDTLSAAEEQKRWNEYHADAKTTKNLYATAFASLIGSGERTIRQRRAQLRLVRTAAHYYATGEILALDDPFGTTLRHRLEADRLKLWGIGMNLVDDGGMGEWPNTVREDIVLEIPRR